MPTRSALAAMLALSTLACSDGTATDLAACHGQVANLERDIRAKDELIRRQDARLTRWEQQQEYRLQGDFLGTFGTPKQTVTFAAFHGATALTDCEEDVKRRQVQSLRSGAPSVAMYCVRAATAQ